MSKIRLEFRRRLGLRLRLRLRRGLLCKLVLIKSMMTKSILRQRQDSRARMVTGRLWTRKLGESSLMRGLKSTRITWECKSQRSMHSKSWNLDTTGCLQKPFWLHVTGTSLILLIWREIKSHRVML
jgi:hypothetical protein